VSNIRHIFVICRNWRQEQAEYEEKFWDEENGGIPEKIESSALNNWL